MLLPGSSIWVTLAFLLQVIPYHLQGFGRVEELLVLCVGDAQELKTDWFGRLCFHLSRASASLFDAGSALLKDSKTTQARIFANKTQSCRLDMVRNSGESFYFYCCCLQTLDRVYKYASRVSPSNFRAQAFFFFSFFSFFFFILEFHCD